MPAAAFDHAAAARFLAGCRDAADQVAALRVRHWRAVGGAVEGWEGPHRATFGERADAVTHLLWRVEEAIAIRAALVRRAAETAAALERAGG